MRRTVDRGRRDGRDRGATRRSSGNLLEMAEMNEWLIVEPPRTFREACQWIAWYQMIARMYNGSGALDQLDERLRPFYERDVAAGILDRRGGDLPHRLPAHQRHRSTPSSAARLPTATT